MMNPILSLLLTTPLLLTVLSADIPSYTKCPAKDSECSYQDQTYALDNKRAPECWKPNYNGNDYNCIPVDGNGDCPESYINVKANCIKLEPPKCPAANEGQLKCEAFGDIKSATAEKPGGNICWYKGSNGNWNCVPAGENNECEGDQLDITTCTFDVAEDKAKCPPKDKYDTKCTTKDGKEFTFLKPDVYHCWHPENGQWKCGRKSFGSCDKHEIDITQCEVENPVPSCPNQIDYRLKCVSRSLTTATAGNPENLKCWSKARAGSFSWLCKPPVDGKCGPKELDITTCPFIKPETKCLPRESKCDFNGKNYEIFDPSGPKCWKKKSYGDGYDCQYRDQGAVKCPKGFMDVKECYPKCPSKEASCDTVDENLTPSNVLASLKQEYYCWDPSNGNTDPLSFNCLPKVKSTGLCPLGSVDISKCGIY